MPVTPTFPGVYIEEIPSGVRTITGVATSITAFVGRALQGPVNEPINIHGFGDFERTFGGLWVESTLGYAVRDFFVNGGGEALIVRLFRESVDSVERAGADKGAKELLDAAEQAAQGEEPKPDKVLAAVRRADEKIQKEIPPANASATETRELDARKAASRSIAEAVAALVKPGAEGPELQLVLSTVRLAAMRASAKSKAEFTLGSLNFEASSPGKWSSGLGVAVSTREPLDPNDKIVLFDLTIRDSRPGGLTEKFLDLSLDPASTRRADKVLEEESQLLRWKGDLPTSAVNFHDIGELGKMVRDARKQFDAAGDAKTLDEAWFTPKKDSTPETGLIVELRKFWTLALDPLSRAQRELAETQGFLQRLRAMGAKDELLQNVKNLEERAKKALDDKQREVANSLSDGQTLNFGSFVPAGGQIEKKGIFALEKADLFNLLCITPHERRFELGASGGDIEQELIAEAISYCEKRRAMLIIDPRSTWKTKEAAKEGIKDQVGEPGKNAAVFFPRLRQPDPLKEGKMHDFVPCGAVAGVFARTDATRGVWKAPAGLDATLKGVPQLTVPLTDAENGELNPLGINCLRVFPAAGRVVWGARTRVGNDRLASEWKYLPVRRTALFIEESLYRGTQWIVFEPNDEPLWAQIRLNIGAFMQNLFRQGAFQGKSPKEAYFVKCDNETTTQTDINLGIVNIIVGFAPLKPAEFVIIKLQQMAGQIET